MKLQVGVKLVIEKDGKYLFIRRAQSFKPGPQKWDIPGGRIEEGERLREALAREVKEEVSLELRSGERLLFAQDIFAPEKDLHVVRLTYVGAASGTVRLSDEHDAFRWMTLHEIRQEEYVDTYLKEVLILLQQGEN